MEKSTKKNKSSMRRALQRANTYHASLPIPGTPPQLTRTETTTTITTTTPPTLNSLGLKNPEIQTPEIPKVVISGLPKLEETPKNINSRSGGNSRKERHASTRTPKKRERSQTKPVNFPQVTSTPILPNPGVSEKSGISKTGNYRTQVNISELFGKISASWEKPVSQTPLSGDLPRLASRIVIQDFRSGKNSEYHPREDDPPKIMVAEILHQICNMAEQNETAAELLRHHVTRTKDDPGELRHWTETLLETAGAESKTVGVCKTMCQSIIMPAATQIKVVVFSLTNGFTKDVRTSDGWRIILRFSDEDITCTHIKKEISMATGSNEFEFEWRLSVSLNPQVEKIVKVRLSVNGLRCDEGMAKEQKQKLTDAIAGMVCDG